MKINSKACNVLVAFQTIVWLPTKMRGSSNAMQSQDPLLLKIISEFDFPEVCDRVAPIYSYHCSTDITAPAVPAAPRPANTLSGRPCRHDSLCAVAGPKPCARRRSRHDWPPAAGLPSGELHVGPGARHIAGESESGVAAPPGSLPGC